MKSMSVIYIVLFGNSTLDYKSCSEFLMSFKELI